jgi:hypothetical protein
MRKLRTIVVFFSLCLFAVFTHAQAAPVAPPPASSGSGNGEGTVRIETKTGFMGGIVGSIFTPNDAPGQPFSADVVEETDQTLSDGNHIHRETHGKFFRDSQGRTRSETELGAFGPGSRPFVHIMIMDLVDGRFISLDPEHKLATINHFGKLMPHSGAGAANRTAAGTGLSASAGGIPAPGHAAARIERSEIERSKEDLGTMTIEGFTVIGTRYSNTTPAGTIGNDKPITTISERWFSPDLKMDLVNSSDNPESGKHVQKLTNIRTGDPDPLLFQVPADFTVTERQQ